MEDYPRDLLEFESRFATEEACRDYLFALRWPDGFRCPSCGHERAWPVRKVWFECARCRRQTSVTAGTIFQDTRKPLRLWFRAMWHVVSQKNGVSALGLQRVLGLGSYQTAWTWMHKLRRAMVRPGRERLTGVVEVDETYWGAEEEGVRGRQTERKALIAVAAEERGSGLGRIRMRRVRNAGAASLMPFVEESVEPASVVRTDGWLGYEPLEKKGYQHCIVFLKGRREQASELLPLVHKAISLLKRCCWDAPRGGQPRAPGLLSGRVRVPFSTGAAHAAAASSSTGWCNRLWPLTQPRIARSLPIGTPKSREPKPQNIGVT